MTNTIQNLEKPASDYVAKSKAPQKTHARSKSGPTHRQFSVTCLEDMQAHDPLLKHLNKTKQVYLYGKLRSNTTLEQLSSKFDPSTVESPLKMPVYSLQPPILWEQQLSPPIDSEPNYSTNILKGRFSKLLMENITLDNLESNNNNDSDSASEILDELESIIGVPSRASWHLNSINSSANKSVILAKRQTAIPGEMKSAQYKTIEKRSKRSNSSPNLPFITIPENQKDIEYFLKTAEMNKPTPLPDFANDQLKDKASKCNESERSQDLSLPLECGPYGTNDIINKFNNPAFFVNKQNQNEDFNIQFIPQEHGKFKENLESVNEVDSKHQQNTQNLLPATGAKSKKLESATQKIDKFHPKPFKSILKKKISMELPSFLKLDRKVTSKQNQVKDQMLFDLNNEYLKTKNYEYKNVNKQAHSYPPKFNVNLGLDMPYRKDEPSHFRIRHPFSIRLTNRPTSLVETESNEEQHAILPFKYFLKGKGLN